MVRIWRQQVSPAPPRCSEAREDLQSFQWSLGILTGLSPVEHAWKISTQKMVILITCPKQPQLTSFDTKELSQSDVAPYPVWAQTPIQKKYLGSCSFNQWSINLMTACEDWNVDQTRPDCPKILHLPEEKTPWPKGDIQLENCGLKLKKADSYPHYKPIVCWKSWPEDSKRRWST